MSVAVTIMDGVDGDKYVIYVTSDEASRVNSGIIRVN